MKIPDATLREALRVLLLPPMERAALALSYRGNGPCPPFLDDAVLHRLRHLGYTLYTVVPGDEEPPVGSLMTVHAGTVYVGEVSKTGREWYARGLS